jgi:hypothetical protein
MALCERVSAVSAKLLSEIRKRLAKEGVVGVVVGPSGRMVDAVVDRPCPRIPRGGRLYSALVGSRRLVEAVLVV